MPLAWMMRISSQDFILKIESLTVFRFVAAVIVVIFHFGQEATGFSGLLIAGPQMVTFFFVLSGFVMAVAYFKTDKIKIRTYWWARVARIMPIYLLALLLMLVINHIKGSEHNLTALMLHLTLLQAWFSPHPLSINSPGWSLSVEAFFYLMFPLILLILKKYKISVSKMVMAALILWMITQVILSSALSTDFYRGYPSLSHDFIFYFPLVHLCSFLWGIVGGIWFLQKKTVLTNPSKTLALTLLSVWLIIFILNDQMHIEDLLPFTLAFESSFLSPFFLFFILSLAMCRSKFISLLTWKPFLLLGEASYSLYILQVPIHSLYRYGFESHLTLTPLLNFCLYLILLISLSIVSFLFFEKPVNKFLRFSLPKYLIRYMPKRLPSAIARSK